eukprot:g2068.t1
MGCGSSSPTNKFAGSGVLPGVSIDNRPFKPDPTSTDVSVIHFPPNSETIDIYWYFHESGLTVPSVSPTGQVKLFEDYFKKNLIGKNHNYKVNVPELLKVADICKQTNRVFLTVDILSLNGRALLNYIFHQKWFYTKKENVVVIFSPTIDLAKDDATHPLLFGGGHMFSPTIKCLELLVSKAKLKSCKCKFLFIPRNIYCQQNNFMLQKFLPDIIQEIIELDEEKYHRGKGKKLIKRNSHTNTNVKGKKKTKKNKVHAHDEALESMHSMDGLDLDDFVMDGGNDGNGTNEKFEVSRLATDTHTMAEEWHEEIDLSDAHQNTMEKADEFVFDDDEFNSSASASKDNSSAGASKHKLHISNNGQCFYLVGNGMNVQTFFSNCFESIMVEKSYFHLEQSMNYKSLSKKKQVKEDGKAEQELIKRFAAVSDMFDSQWDGIGRKKRIIERRGPEDDFSNEYYESMPISDDSLWPSGSLLIVSLSDAGHGVATVLKKKDKKNRKNNIYVRGNRLDSLLKQENLLSNGYATIFLIIDVEADFENFKKFKAKDLKHLPLIIIAILPRNHASNLSWANTATFLCDEIDVSNLTIFLQKPSDGESILSSHAFWFLINIINCTTCLSNVAKHLNPFPDVHHATAFIAMSGVGFNQLVEVTTNDSDEASTSINVYSSWCVFQGKGGIGDGFDGKDEQESQQGIEKAVMDFTEARSPTSPFVSAAASSVRTKPNFKGSHTWSLISICPQSFVQVVVKALSAADEAWHGDDKDEKISRLSGLVAFYRDLSKSKDVAE